jgi:uncharacterized protein (TIGR03437 family)
MLECVYTSGWEPFGGSMSGRKIFFALFVCLFSSLFTFPDRAIPIPTKMTGLVEAQSGCTPPLYQGYGSGCSNINLRWLNRDPISMISHYEIYRHGMKVGQVGGSAISFSEAVGCSFGATYTIRQVMKSGASCQTVTGGMVPHTKPCDLCGSSGGGGGGGGGGAGGSGGGILNVVSAASLKAPAAPGAIATVFADAGQTLTSTTASATGFPLPTNISGTQVLVNGAPAGLFYVSPNQINFLMPSSATGAVNLTVIGSGGQRLDGSTTTAPNPAIFTANGRGSGVAAALVTSDGRSFQRVADASGNAIPISVGSSGRPNYLILFGTGLRNQGAIQLRIGGRDCRVVWSGPHSQMAGLDQINAQLNDSLRGAGVAQLVVTVGGFTTNSTTINIGNQ